MKAVNAGGRTNRYLNYNIVTDQKGTYDECHA